MKKFTRILLVILSAVLWIFTTLSAFADSAHLYLSCESFRSKKNPGILHYTKDHQSGSLPLRYFRVTYDWSNPANEAPYGFDGTGIPEDWDKRLYYGANTTHCVYQADNDLRIYCDAESKATLRKVLVGGKAFYESHAFMDSWDYTYYFREDECRFSPFEKKTYKAGEKIVVGLLRQIKQKPAEIFLKVEEKPNTEFPILINVWANDGIYATLGSFSFENGNLIAPGDDGVIWGYDWPVEELGYVKNQLEYDFNGDGVLDLLKVEPLSAPYTALAAYRLVIEIR